MVAELRMKRVFWFLFVAVALVMAGCGEAPGPDLEKAEAQPPADLEAGRNAQTLDQWAQANPNNGAPGHGENTDK